jgi:hypothetical protein
VAEKLLIYKFLNIFSTIKKFEAPFPLQMLFECLIVKFMESIDIRPPLPPNTYVALGIVGKHVIRSLLPPPPILLGLLYF